MRKQIELTPNLFLVISKPTINDAEQVVDFLNTVGGETDFLTFGLNEFPFSLDEEKQVISECLKKNICLMLVGKIENVIVSQLFLQRSDKPRLSHIGDIAVSVSKNYWGHSIGKHMMLAGLEWARCNNITKVQLQVRTDNERAVQLYKNLGFVIEGKITQALKIGNTYFDDYLMGLHL